MTASSKSVTPIHYRATANAELTPRAPFHFDGTFEKPSHFPTSLYHWSPGVFHQTIRIEHKIIGVGLRDRGNRRKPRIDVEMFHSDRLGADEQAAVLAEITYRYELKSDLRSFRAVVYRDVPNRVVFRRWMGMRASTPYSLYELMVVGLMLQNTQARRSVQMLEALIDRYGQRLAFDGVAISAIWTPNDVAFEDENDLRALRIGYRAKALLRFSKQFADGEVSEHSFREMDDAQLREALLLLYGVGPETARILQTEAFHRHTVFDHIAPWQQKIYSRLLYGKKKVAARRIINDVKRKYGEYSALAVHYLWEDLFWKRQSQTIGWLEAEIRL